MKGWIVACGAAGVLLGAAPPVLADDGLPGPVYRRFDRASGAVIRLYRPAPDRGIVEVTTPQVRLWKTLEPGRSETRVVRGAEDLTVTLDTRGVSVTDARLGLSLAGRDEDALARLRRHVQASAAVVAALDLLDRLEPVPGSPVTHTLLVTQALLASALDRPDAGGKLEAWLRRPLGRVSAVAVGWQEPQEPAQVEGDSAATACWDQYAAEAIAAYIQYEQCVDSEEWWDVPGMLSCLLIYDMRAIGAFSWWVSCVGFRG